MNETSMLMFSCFALAVSALALLAVLRLDAKGRTEYGFFLREYTAKTGKVPGWRQKVSAYNAALGGPSPKWHWIKPVLAPSDHEYL